MKRYFGALIGIVFLGPCFLVLAQSLSELDEARAIRIGQTLRCVVCQNQSIEESDSALAKDMRLKVRQSIAAGQSDMEIRQYMSARYGDFILIKPPLQINTWVLWGAPFALIGLALIWFVRIISPVKSAENK